MAGRFEHIMADILFSLIIISVCASVRKSISCICHYCDAGISDN